MKQGCYGVMAALIVGLATGGTEKDRGVGKKSDGPPARDEASVEAAEAMPKDMKRIQEALFGEEKPVIEAEGYWDAAGLHELWLRKSRDQLKPEFIKGDWNRGAPVA